MQGCPASEFDIVDSLGVAGRAQTEAMDGGGKANRVVDSVGVSPRSCFGFFLILFFSSCAGWPDFEMGLPRCLLANVHIVRTYRRIRGLYAHNVHRAHAAGSS